MDADDFPATVSASPLRLARKAAGVSPTTLARRAGVSRVTYYRDEVPGAEIPLRRVEAYAEALGVKPAALVGWEPLEVAA